MSEINPELIAPHVPAEHVALEVLRESEPRRGLPKASALIEQAYHGHPDLLIQAQEIIDAEKGDRLQFLRAVIYDAYLPMHYARIEKRWPDAEEMLDTYGALHEMLPTYSSFIRKSDEDIDALYGKDFSLSPAARGRIRTFAQGLAGEAVTLYLSLFSALSQGKDVLYPSSFREDNPPLEHVIPQYGNELHDAHTYNPAELSLRALLSVKTSYNKTGSKSDKVVLFRLLQNASAALNEVVQQTDPSAEPQRIDINTVLDLLVAAEDIDSGLHGTAVTFRQKFADRLQNVIQTHPAMAKMKIEV